MFKVGDAVKIKRRTRFAHQTNKVGIIVNETDKKLWWSVRFIDGFLNSYQDDDLEVADPITLLKKGMITAGEYTPLKEKEYNAKVQRRR